MESGRSAASASIWNWTHLARQLFTSYRCSIVASGGFVRWDCRCRWPAPVREPRTRRPSSQMNRASICSLVWFGRAHHRRAAGTGSTRERTLRCLGPPLPAVADAPGARYVPGEGRTHRAEGSRPPEPPAAAAGSEFEADGASRHPRVAPPQPERTAGPNLRGSRAAGRAFCDEVPARAGSPPGGPRPVSHRVASTRPRPARLTAHGLPRRARARMLDGPMGSMDRPQGSRPGAVRDRRRPRGAPAETERPRRALVREAWGEPMPPSPRPVGRTVLFGGPNARGHTGAWIAQPAGIEPPATFWVKPGPVDCHSL